MTRRKAGSGGISLRKDGRWEGRIVTGYDDKGKPITKNVFGKTKTECSVKLEQLRNVIQPSSNKSASDMTFGEWLDFRYQTFMKPGLRPTTQIGYENAIYKHIIPHIGKIKVKDITTGHLQKFYSVLKTDGRVIKAEIYGKGLSDRSVRASHAICKIVLDAAVREGIIRHNPASECKLPPKKAREMKTLTHEEIRRLLIQAREEDFFELLLLDLSTGLRRGELLALKWTDINFESGEMNVCRQVNTINGELIISEPKTKNSVRTIVLAEPILGVLRKYRKSTDSTWLFPSPLNPDLPREPSGCRKKLAQILVHAGCKHVRFHDLRHTFATLALGGGMDVKTLSDLLGHSSAEITLNTYSHITDGMRKAAANAINRGIAGAKTEKVNTERNAEKPSETTFVPYKGKIRKRGTGCLTKINENLWEGRYTPTIGGRRVARNVYAHSEEECETALARLIREMNAERKLYVSKSGTQQTKKQGENHS